MTLRAQQDHERLYQTMAIIVANIPIGPGTYRLTLLAPEITAAARPGQFVEILPGAKAAMDPPPAAAHLHLCY